MLQQVHIQPQPNHLERYRDSVRAGVIEQIREESRDFVGCNVLHVNATAYGGGVAEILSSMIPLMRDLGIHADWKVITGTDEFFGVTKAMHNALQGKAHPWTAHERDVWIEQNRLNAEHWEDYDYVFIHDPQPAPLLAILKAREGGPPEGKWIWRCHIDLTNAQPEAWDLLRPFVQEYDGSIWTMRQYVREGVPERNLMIAPPAIDPLSPKNAPIGEEVISDVFARYRVDLARPVICQVSRFDPWKDPLGVIDAYRIAKRDHPGVQLVLVGSMANDDPEGWEWWEKVARHAGEDWDVKILSNLNGVGNLEVNAFQQASQVVIQKSTREGFGLVVAEGLWKGKPCVGGNVGGIPMQIVDGQCGYLVDSPEECGQRVSELLSDPESCSRMGNIGREHVRDNFLITRYLHDYLKLMKRVSNGVIVE
ncbi:MAG: glycosyltransferase [Chloroflexi bacterium]|nr:glycosyltransferase [Chloroflexota bacterium]